MDSLKAGVISEAESTMVSSAFIVARNSKTKEFLQRHPLADLDEIKELAKKELDIPENPDGSFNFRKIFRIVVDYSRVNQILVKNYSQIKPVNEHLQSLGNARYISQFDFSGFYKSLPFGSCCNSFASFKVHDNRVFKPNSSTEGLSSLPTFGHRIALEIISRMPNYSKHCIGYLDDISLKSNYCPKTEHDPDEKCCKLFHLQIVKEFLDQVNKVNLMLSLAKSKICVQHADILGFEVDTTGERVKFKPIIDRTNFLEGLKKNLPTNLTQLRSLLGMISYLSPFLSGQVHKAAPIYAMTRNKKNRRDRIEWTPMALKALDDIILDIKHMTANHVMCPQDKGVLFVDVGISAVGGFMVALTPEGNVHAISYFSKFLNPSLRKAGSSYKKELYGTLICSNHFQYLANYSQDLYIATDCKAVSLYVMRSRIGQTASLYDRIVAKLCMSPFRFIMSIPRTQNVVADYLSKLVQQDYSMDNRTDQPFDKIKNIDINTIDRSKVREIAEPGEILTMVDVMDRVDKLGNDLLITESANDNESANDPVEDESDEKYEKGREKELKKLSKLDAATSKALETVEFDKVHLMQAAIPELNFNKILRLQNSQDFIDLEQILSMQSKDEELADIIRNVRLGSKEKRFEPYFLDQGVLFRKDKKKTRIMLANKALANVVGKFHSKFHFGIGKSYKLLSAMIYNPNLRQQIEMIAAGCLLCKRLEENVFHTKLHLPAAKTCNMAYMDFASFPKTIVNGFTYSTVLVLTCSRCQKTWSKPQLSTSAQETLQSILSIVSTSNFEMIVSDNDRVLGANEQLKVELEKYGIQTRTILRYSPKANLAETSVKALRKLVLKLDQNAEHWTSYIHFATFLLNSAPRAFAMNSKKFISPNILHNSNLKPATSPFLEQKALNSIIKSFHNDFDSFHEAREQGLAKERSRIKNRWKVGDLCLLKFPGYTKNTARMFKQLYRVVSFRGTSVTIAEVNGTKSQKVHTSRLIKINNIYDTPNLDYAIKKELAEGNWRDIEFDFESDEDDINVTNKARSDRIKRIDQQRTFLDPHDVTEILPDSSSDDDESEDPDDPPESSSSSSSEDDDSPSTSSRPKRILKRLFTKRK